MQEAIRTPVIGQEETRVMETINEIHMIMVVVPRTRNT